MVFRKARRPTRPSRVGQPAPPLSGVDPAGQPVSADPEGRTVYFLTSTCQPCRPVWAALGAGAVVVTPDPSTEDRRMVAELGGPAVTVVMSSDTWFAYAPGPAPWAVTVGGGIVTAEGPAAGS